MKFTRGLLVAGLALAATFASPAVANAAASDPTFVTPNLSATALGEDAGTVNVLVQWDAPSYPAAATGDRAGGVRIQRCTVLSCPGNWVGVSPAPPATDANPQVATTCPAGADSCTFRVQPYYFKAYCRYWTLLDFYENGVYTWSGSYGSRRCARWGNRLVLGSWSMTSVSPWPAAFGV